MSATVTGRSKNNGEISHLTFTRMAGENRYSYNNFSARHPKVAANEDPKN
jgi:hypothetical protein